MLIIFKMSLISKIVALAPVLHEIDFFSPNIESWTDSSHTTAARITLCY